MWYFISHFKIAMYNIAEYVLLYSTGGTLRGITADRWELLFISAWLVTALPVDEGYGGPRLKWERGGRWGQTLPAPRGAGEGKDACSARAGHEADRIKTRVPGGRCQRKDEGRSVTQPRCTGPCRRNACTKRAPPNTRLCENPPRASRARPRSSWSPAPVGLRQTWLVLYRGNILR